MPEAFPPLGPEFEPFLYAVLGDERNGTPLTIVSALARTGVDPWEEAARIAALPEAAALAILGRMCPGGGADALANATRILGLLPVTRKSRARANPIPNRDAASWSPFILVVLALLLALTLLSIFWTQPALGQIEQSLLAPTAKTARP